MKKIPETFEREISTVADLFSQLEPFLNKRLLFSIPRIDNNDLITLGPAEVILHVIGDEVIIVLTDNKKIEKKMKQIYKKIIEVRKK